MLSQTEALLTLLAFSILMLTVGIWTRKKDESPDDFILMDRKQDGLSGAFRIAVSWIWAPAVFICSLKSFTYGLRAYVTTDKVRMAMILFISLILVPLVFVESGGRETLLSGLGGNEGLYTDLFNPFVAYSFGVAATICLISGPVADQMFHQRAFAMPRAIFASIILSVISVLPLSIYANVTENPDLTVLSAILSPLTGLIICSLSVLTSETSKKNGA